MFTLILSLLVWEWRKIVRIFVIGLVVFGVALYTAPNPFSLVVFFGGGIAVGMIARGLGRRSRF